MPLVSIKFIMSQLLLAIHFNPPQVMQDKKKNILIAPWKLIPLQRFP